VSAEIESLQSRSTALNARLDNRKNVERVLRPSVEDVSISPSVVRKISEGTIDEHWPKALEELEKRSTAIAKMSNEQKSIKAVNDIKPLLEHLSDKVITLSLLVLEAIHPKVKLGSGEDS
jgi:hypothetical protein